jgi:polyisoprenoid-binding protein YceI
MHITRKFILVLALLLAACGPVNPDTSTLPTHTPSQTATTLIVWPDESTIGFSAQALGGSLTVQGTYDVTGGQVTLTPEADQLRVHAYLLIDTASVTVGNAVIDEALRLGMDTANYPIATFDARSTTLVPITEEEVEFILEGTLRLHGETQPVTMTIGPATVIDNHMIGHAQMGIDLADFEISLPEAVVNSAIQLDVLLIADITPPPTQEPADQSSSAD